ncbi:WRKY transcription factor 22-like, partial [Neltuma alba]|uniref:WRKY transcription factor 22-like n=1 Tax=Neltuma alba TaxID=207710 RepID=UPI0010A2D7BC
MAEGWDLSAVVRGCRSSSPSSATAAASTTTSITTPSSSSSKDLSLPLIKEEKTSSLSPLLKQSDEKKVYGNGILFSAFYLRKRSTERMVCHVTAENLTADSWAWRKYGQ